MASSRRGGAVTAFAALALSFSAGAQDQPAFRTGTNLVTVPAVVTDERGVHVAGLQRSDFRLLDNGEDRQLTGFWPASDLPLTLGIVIDASESQRSQLLEHEDAAHQFIDAALRLGERAFIARTGRRVTLNWEGVRTPNGFRQVVLPVAGKPLGDPCVLFGGRSLCGETALWNAVYAAAQLKFTKAEGSKALVVLSDGVDTGSTHSLDDTIEQCNRQGVAVYAVHYPMDDGVPSGARLQELARKTGGANFEPPNGNFAPIFARIEADLRSQYILGFEAADGPAGEVHKIDVQVRRPSVVIRARSQYAIPEHE